jgi:hypothetical protein
LIEHFAGGRIRQVVENHHLWLRATNLLDFLRSFCTSLLFRIENRELITHEMSAFGMAVAAHCCGEILPDLGFEPLGRDWKRWIRL